MTAVRMRLSCVSLRAATAAVLLGGCVSLAPEYQRPEAPVASAWPDGSSGEAASPAATLGWEDVFTDPRLRQLIALALRNNRDLRVTARTVERSRALFRVQRADRMPQLNASAQMNRARTPADLSGTGAAVTGSEYSVDLGTSWELDLFGRVKSLSDQALEIYLASEEAQRAARLSLVAELATQYLQLAADVELQQLSGATLESRQTSFELTRRAYELGVASALTLSQIQTTVESARVDLALYSRYLAQDRNALVLLAGGEIPRELLPTTLNDAGLGVDALPGGLPSATLQRRPDILQSERELRAANAAIGAARAAFFPSIRLTASGGTASAELSGLFDGGSGTWSFVPRVDLPIFRGGANRANLAAATAARDIAVARYEGAIQSAFREVADALATQSTLDEQLSAQRALTEATRASLELSQQRFDRGVDSYLTVLDAQRSSFSAAQGLINARLLSQTNRITLYRALGGGWQQAVGVTASAR